MVDQPSSPSSSKLSTSSRSTASRSTGSRARRIRRRLKTWLRPIPGVLPAYLALRDLYDRLRLRGRAPAEVFGEIYRHRSWGSGTTHSGPGSTLEQTRALREELPALWRELGVRSVLDLPCGDFVWMQHVALDGVDYLGADLVPELIAENRRRFARPGVDFRVLDLLVDELPPVDLVLCRDCLVHLSFADCRRALATLRRSGTTWVLLTSFDGGRRNRDIATGQWRALDLEAPPFSLPPPHRRLDERCTEAAGRFADKFLGLWRIEDLESPVLENGPS